MAEQSSQLQINENVSQPNINPQNNIQIIKAIVQSTVRKQGGLAMWLIVTILSASIPCLNLYLLLYQPPNLTKTMAKTTYEVDKLGQERQFINFIYTAVAYLIINLVFIGYSIYLAPNVKQMLKKYFLIQNIFICCLAANICYAAVHIVALSSVFSTDQDNFLQPAYEPRAMDIIIVILYVITNISFTGIFKILMVNIHWQPYQIIIYKLAIIMSSLLYFITGIIFIIGKDQLSSSIDDFINKNAKIIKQLYFSGNFDDMEQIPFFQNINTSIKQAKGTITSFIILYVFTNFALSFQIIAKMSDFDLTCELKAQYILTNEKQQ